MKEIILRIPEKKFHFFMEMMKQPGFAEVVTHAPEVPAHHKSIIRQRMKKLQNNKLSDWNSIKDEFKTT